MTRERYYIFCYFSGGWDILVGLDPRDPGVFSDDRLRSTLIQPGYDRLDGVNRNVIYTPNGMMLGPHTVSSYVTQMTCGCPRHEHGDAHS